MKHLLTFVAAAMMSLTTMAQENLAIGGTAKATSGNADAAIDNNEGTRWESAFEDPQTWQLDMGEAKEFNVIQIKWEGAYTKTYKIEAGDEVDADGWLTGGEVIAEGVNNAMPNLQTIKLDAAKTARYIKYTCVDRGTAWGNSFWEFRVFNHTNPVLSSLKLEAASTLAKAGESIALTTTAFDQIGLEMEAGEVEYTVNPADAGSVTDNVFTPSKAGLITVTAKKGEIVSNAVEFKAYNGDKLELTTDMVTSTFGTAPKEDGMANAFDADEESQWVISENVDGADNVYEAGFVLDLGAVYNVTAVSARFEGACPADYAIDFAGADEQWIAPAAFTVTNHPGMATFTNLHIAADAASALSGVRYVRFTSTKAATQYGIKIKDFSVFAELPTIDELTAEVLGETSAKLTIKGTDLGGEKLTYTVSYKGNEWTSGAVASGTAVETTFEGLKAGTSYTFTVVATNESGIKSAKKTVKVTTEGTPDPNLWLGAEKTPSVYYAPGWAQTNDYTFEVGDNSAKYVLPTATTEQWQAQFSINTDITTAAANEYDFKCNITADKDVKATVKLFQTGNNDLYYFSDDVSLKAGETFVIAKKHVKMAGIDMTAVTLLLDFGGNPANLTVNVSYILFKVNDGEEPGDDTNGISHLSEVRERKGAGVRDMYNLAGQRVSDGYKGIVIRNGKKMIIR